MNPCLEAAFQYQLAGLHPIPVEPRGKRPLVRWKDYQDRQPTLDEVSQWWTANPDANVALVLGRGMFAVDVDSIEGANALLAAGVPWGAEPMSLTSKGFHLFLAGDTADRIGLVKGVDIRGVGYVVAPPSVHESGHVYRWERPITGKLPPAPPELLALLAQPMPKASVVNGQDWLTAALVGVDQGGRDATCTRLAGYLLGKGMPQDAVDLILQAWAERCTPPFPPDQVSKCVASIAKREGAPAGPPSGIRDLLDRAMHEITAPPSMRPKLAATGLPGLDELLGGGVEAGDYVILGARPSVGKTALKLQIARHRAKQGDGVLIASLEMSATRLVRRMLAQEAQVRAHNLKTGQLIDLELTMLKQAAERLAELPLWITSDVRTPEQLRETLASYQPGVLGLVAVDYLQLMRTAEVRNDPRARVEHCSRELKLMAVEFNVPILVLSSLSRPPKDRANWEPSLGDLRESGELEHDADLVWLLHRPDLNEGKTELIQAKSRDGVVGRVHLDYAGHYLTFTEGR